jgi:hypothetical protein
LSISFRGAPETLAPLSSKVVDAAPDMRTIELPAEIQSEKPRQVFEVGVLEVWLPRRKELKRKETVNVE